MALQRITRRSWLPQSLVWRVFMLYAGTLLLCVGLGVGLFYRYKMTDMLDQAHGSALMLTDVAAQTITESAVIGDFDTIERTLDKLILRSPFASATFIELGGARLAAFKPTVQRAPLWLQSMVDSHLSDINQIIKEGGRDYGVLRLQFDVEELAYDLWSVILASLVLGLAALGVGMVLIWWLLRRWLGTLDRALLVDQSLLPEREPEVERLLGDLPLEFRPMVSALNQTAAHLRQELEVREQALISLREVVADLQLDGEEVGTFGGNDLAQMSAKVAKLVSQWRASRQELEKALAAAAAANVAKSEFLANMSHEIRTPINGVMGYLQLMSRESLDDKTRSYINESLNATRLLLRVLNDVLDFSKIEAGKLDIHDEPFDLLGMFDEVHGLMRAQLGARVLDLRLDLEPGLPRFALGDDIRLRQVLLNLTGNAIKFTERGSVTLRARSHPLSDGRFRLAVEVVDTGIGIGPQQLNRLFQAFQQADGSITRRFGGSGLGLVISQRLIQLMGGDGLRVQSLDGQGSCFGFELVLQTASAEQQRMLQLAAMTRSTTCADRPDGQRLQGWRILLVDDNPTNINVAVNMLESLGADVTIAINGSEALEVLQELGPDFDVVLMDLQMPEMDGFEATRRIKANPLWSGLPVVALTANAMEQDRKACREAGMVDHLAKPFDMDELVRVVRRCAIPQPRRRMD